MGARIRFQKEAAHGTEFVCRIGGHAAYATGLAIATTIATDGAADTAIGSRSVTETDPDIFVPPGVFIHPIDPGILAPENVDIWGPLAKQAPDWAPPVDPPWWKRFLYRPRLGVAPRKDYELTFRNAYPESKAEEVHHAIPQRALDRYPGVVSESEMNSLENLRGTTKADHDEIHREWQKFYDEHPPGTATRKQLLRKVAEIDAKWGKRFDPPVLSLTETVAERTRSLAENTAETAKSLVEKTKDLIPSWGMPSWAVAK
jgi:hypothetical protein